MGHDYRPSRYVTKKAPNSINITDRSHLYTACISACRIWVLP
jgi:hypothetical protein